MSIESIFAEAKKIKVGSVEVEIKQVSFGDIPAVTEVFSLVFSKKDIKKSALELVEHNFEKAIGLIERLTDLKKESIERLSLEYSIQIITAILEENVTFFTQKVVPQIEGLQQKVTGLTKSKG